VDWNEVRVTSLREIQEQLPESANSLEIAIFIKDFLEFVHREHHSLSLEFLAGENLTEIRRYLKQIRGVDGSTVDLILFLRKEYPVFPLNQSMEAVLRRLGIARNGVTRDQRERQLYEFIAPERNLTLHHYLLNHSRELCPLDDADLDCPHCSLRTICSYYARKNVQRKKNISRRTRRRVMRKSVAAKRIRKSASRR
jgi:endonuclease III